MKERYLLFACTNLCTIELCSVRCKKLYNKKTRARKHATRAKLLCRSTCMSFLCVCHGYNADAEKTKKSQKSSRVRKLAFSLSDTQDLSQRCYVR